MVPAIFRVSDFYFNSLVSLESTTLDTMVGINLEEPGLIPPSVCLFVRPYMPAD